MFKLNFCILINRTKMTNTPYFSDIFIVRLKVG